MNSTPKAKSYLASREAGESILNDFYDRLVVPSEPVEILDSRYIRISGKMSPQNNSQRAMFWLDGKTGLGVGVNLETTGPSVLFFSSQFTWQNLPPEFTASYKSWIAQVMPDQHCYTEARFVNGAGRETKLNSLVCQN